MVQVIWYFDFISPYAYLHSTRLGQLPDDVDLVPRPVLFAGFLKHWGQLGPAEIAPKKEFTFRQALWRARRDAIPYNTPPMHPFNPLRALRLAIAMGCELRVIDKIFRAIWVDGHLPDDAAGWAAIQAAVDIGDGDARTADPVVKATLLQNGDQAITDGVFGVPSFVVDGEVFWGDDSLEMMLDHLRDPHGMTAEERRNIVTLTGSAER